MSNTNEIRIDGRMTRDAEVKFIPSGLALASFSIACNKSRKRKPGEEKKSSYDSDDWVNEPHYFEIVAWGDLAEKAGTLAKGQEVKIIGRLQQEKWEKDGKMNYRIKINASVIEPGLWPREKK